MPRSSQFTKVGKRKIELSNLKKVLFPDDHLLKAELIEYYLKIAPTILSHIKGRPLSLVRYPDGITGESFFQKNRPDWAPEWIEYISLGEGEEKKDYILATEEASLVWLANLACIELHQIQSRIPHYEKPDYFVFDLDPPENYPFTQVIHLAVQLREYVESLGYHTFVKTTGRKGLHIVVPIEAKWDFKKVFETVSAIAKAFNEANKNVTTLHIQKAARKGRVLVDIYRNRPGQTIVSPYSVRGNPGAPVSMPLHWEKLVTITDPKVLNMTTVPALVVQEGDAWEGMAAYATTLHTEWKITNKQKKMVSAKTGVSESLEIYSKKRSFGKTPEPGPKIVTGSGNNFVLHRHHASRLHYDLRMEREGTLKCWAVPKGLPPRPGIKRLAVATEDHPVKYLTFEGTIPKGQYGGGDMWIFARGKYEITKEKKNGFYFRLESPQLSAEYRIHQTKDNEWLLERVDIPQVDWLQNSIEPMLAQSQDKPPHTEDYIFEVKWDGIRAFIVLDEGGIKIISRGRHDITRQFPELAIPEAFRATAGLFDSEIVCLEADGRPNFKQVINRMQQTSDSGIERGRVKNPAVCYIFDCLYLDGRPIVHEPLSRRHEWMADAVRKETPYRVSETVNEGSQLFEAAKKMGLEGIMAKQRTSPYLPGKRSTSWLKIKTRQTTECLIIGYTKGKGDREPYFGALHLGSRNGSGLEYLGKVGTGFDTGSLKNIFGELKKIKQIKRPVKERPVDDSQSVWLDPKLFCEVEYASITDNGTLREPVFLRLRPDLD